MRRAAAWALLIATATGCALEVDVVSPTGTDAAEGSAMDTAEASSTGFDGTVQDCDFPDGDGCVFECSAGERCRTRCIGEDCATLCSSSELCDIDCLGGPCSGLCESTDACDLECPGGGCDLTCTSTDRCVLSCPDGGCSLSCSSGTSCQITDCEADCELTCFSTTDCNNSCGVENGCTTVPA